MKLKLLTPILLLQLLFTGCLTQQSNIDTLTVNPEITRGVLDNGLEYFIQENDKPENRIELRLIVDAGSIQEDDNQKGLAHFVEHMAFNGTKNFPKDKLIKYLESLGMGFGPEINAYTSFDETVYKLSIPADDPEILNSALLILEDWAHRISFEDEEIEKERGVIVEEWRGGRGVSGRYRDILFPTLLKGSKYADRLPIGNMDVIQNCDPQLLRDYYKKWYRPDLMAVVVVGNVNVNEMEKLIKNRFNFAGTEEQHDRGNYIIPKLDRIDIEIIQDKEMTVSNIDLFIKQSPLTVNNVQSYREYIKQFLITIMFNGRMEEIYIKPDSPFLRANTGFGSFIRNMGLLSFSVSVEDGKTLSGFEALLEEIEKVKQNGFTDSELNRAKTQVEMIMDNIYNERDNRLSTSVIEDIKRFYLEGDISMSIEDEVKLLQNLLSDITVDEISKNAEESFSGRDRTLTIHMPIGSKKVNEEDFNKLFETVSSKKYAQKRDEELNRKLFDKELIAGFVTSKEFDKDTGITTLILNNGATIVLKPTNFKADEIKFSAVSLGGLSLVKDNEFRSGELSATLASLSGLNGLNAIELDRILTGESVKVSPWIDQYTEGISGSSNREDIETMFQLINLYFTEPEFNMDAYNVLLKNIENSVENRENSPKSIFYDRITELLARGHVRSKPISLKTLKEINFEDSKRIYKERIKDPSDFHFVLTGSFDVNEVEEYFKYYIASIPTAGLKEQAKDIGMRFPEGIIKESVTKGIEDQSVVEIIFNGEFNGSRDDEFGLSVLSKYLEEKLRVKIREELSGTYGASVFSSIRHYPVKKYAFGVYFGCEPGREEELIEAVFQEISLLKSGDIDGDIINSVLNSYKRSMELNIKDNAYWHGNITSLLLMNRDLNEIIDTDTSFISAEYLNKISKIYIDESRYVRVILQPEK